MNELTFYPRDYFLTEKQKQELAEYGGDMDSVHMARLWRKFTEIADKTGENKHGR